ncbi:MAG: hypothetical protein IPJ36_12000 [Simplicispira sp.]|nr:hypothetical protein [Simplicispira sp.]
MKLGNLVIEFSRRRPAACIGPTAGMRVVQALHWLKDTWRRTGSRILEQAEHAADRSDPRRCHPPDLRAGFGTLPA